MVVDAKLHLALEALRQEAGRGDIDGDDVCRGIVRRGKARLNIRQELFRNVGRGADEGRFARPAQGAAKRGGTADGVAVRISVDKDKIIIELLQKLGAFLAVHAVHSLPSVFSTSSSLWSMSREFITALICAPYSMLWSISKTSSGV